MLCRTIWQKTFCSRTRRAMSWPYCAPKSMIRTRSLSGNCVIGVYRLWGRRLLVGTQSKQFLQGRGFVDFSIAPETLDLDIFVFNELDFPILSRSKSRYLNRIVARVFQGVVDFSLIQSFQKSNQFTELVFHF